MNQRCKLERKLFMCPEIDCFDCRRFPLASEDQFMAMGEEYTSDPSSVHILPFVRNVSGTAFIDIYVWDAVLLPECSFRRFLICEGYRLSEEDEDLLFDYLAAPYVSWDIMDLYQVNAEVREVFPHWHLIQYPSYSLSQAIKHAYFASHRCGAKEILFKAGLANIAYNIDKVPSYNIIGTSPETILGAPLKLLRILDQPEFLHFLYDRKQFELCKETYSKYSGYITRLPSICQWEYLKNLLDGGRFTKYGFSRTIYNRLNPIACDGNLEYLDLFEEFLKHQAEIPIFKEMYIPTTLSLGDIVRKMRMITDDTLKDKETDHLIYEIKQQTTYEYQGTAYSVVAPAASSDFYIEALSQGNCLVDMDYIERHSSGEIAILFCRKNSNLLHPFVTLEVKNNEITQVRGKFNSIPEKEVWVFLEEYAQTKGLVFWPGDIILQNAAELDSEIDEDLEEYAKESAHRESPSANQDCGDEPPMIPFGEIPLDETVALFDINSYEIIIPDELF